MSLDTRVDPRREERVFEMRGNCYCRKEIGIPSGFRGGKHSSCSVSEGKARPASGEQLRNDSEVIPEGVAQ